MGRRTPALEGAVSDLRRSDRHLAWAAAWRVTLVTDGPPAWNVAPVYLPSRWGGLVVSHRAPLGGRR